MSALFDRMKAFARLGFMFGTARDLYSVYGYKQRPGFQDFLGKYLRQDIAKRVVDAPAQGTWRKPPEVDGGDAFNAKWEELILAHNIWHMLERVDKLAGIGQFAALLVGFDDSAELDMPISGEANIIYLQPYSEGSIAIKDFDKDTKSPRFGLPLSYEFKAADPSSTVIDSAISSSRLSTKDLKVHHSRVLHVAENCLEDNIVGNSRLLSIYNLLDDLSKVVGGSAETFWLTSNRGMQADVDKEMDLDPVDAKELADELDEYQHQLRRVIRTRGVKLKVLDGDVADPSGTFDVLIGLVAGTTGIPRRILLGSEVGQLASEQDRANWADRINERNTSFAEPSLLRPFITLLQGTKTLPDGTVKIVWSEAFNSTPLEAAQVMAQKARAVTNFSKQDQFGTPIVTQEEAREILGLPPEGGPEQNPTTQEDDIEDDEKDEIPRVVPEPGN